MTAKVRKKNAQRERQGEKAWIADEITEELMQISNGLWLEHNSFVRSIYRDTDGDFHPKFVRENLEAISNLEIALDGYGARIERLLRQLGLHVEQLMELHRRS